MEKEENTKKEPKKVTRKAAPKKTTSKTATKPSEKVARKRTVKKEEQVVKKEEKGTFKTTEVLVLILVTCVMTVTLMVGLYRIFNRKVINKVVADADLQEFIDNYNYIIDNYYTDVDKKAALKGAIDGLLKSLGDGYSTVIDESEDQLYNIQLEGEYEGIGIEVQNTYEEVLGSDGQIAGYIYKDIQVTDVFPGSSAEQAGIKIGDIVSSINGISMSGKLTTDLTDVIKVSGKDGVSITVNRGSEQFTYTVKSSKVEIPSVLTEIIDNNGKKVAHIKIELFAANTDEQFSKALKELDPNIKDIIIDVRDNSGGHLTTVENMLSTLLDSTHVIYQLENKKETVKVYSTGNKTKEYNIVVLTNHNSASASELLAIALKEEYGATLVGTQTFGKGTVQELVTTGNDNDRYKVTTKKWLSPKGNWINSVGVTPNVVVEQTSEAISQGLDLQLQKALETLSK